MLPSAPKPYRQGTCLNPFTCPCPLTFKLGPSDLVFERSSSVHQCQKSFSSARGHEQMTGCLNFAGELSRLHYQHHQLLPSKDGSAHLQLVSVPVGFTPIYFSAGSHQQYQEDAACCGSCHLVQVPPLTVQRTKGNQAPHGVLWVLLSMAGLENKVVPETSM